MSLHGRFIYAIGISFPFSAWLSTPVCLFLSLSLFACFPLSCNNLFFYSPYFTLNAPALQLVRVSWSKAQALATHRFEQQPGEQGLPHSATQPTPEPPTFVHTGGVEQSADWGEKTNTMVGENLYREMLKTPLLLAYCGPKCTHQRSWLFCGAIFVFLVSLLKVFEKAA